jgi:hypothetical protein
LREAHLLAVSPLDLEGVPEEDEVGHASLERALLLETSAKSVEDAATELSLVGREETKLLELGDEDGALSLERLERVELCNDSPRQSALITIVHR